jgi:hypothetical protein
MKAKRPPRNTRAGAIWFAKYPSHHAQSAFKAGYYVEALQVLHGWLEVKHQEWLLLSRHKNTRGSVEEVWDAAFGIPLLQAAKALFVTGKMPKSTFDTVCKFNSMRNKVIHQMFHEKYESGAVPISFKDCEKTFAVGLKLCERLENRLATLATRGKVGKPDAEA